MNVFLLIVMIGIAACIIIPMAVRVGKRNDVIRKFGVILGAMEKGLPLVDEDALGVLYRYCEMCDRRYDDTDDFQAVKKYCETAKARAEIRSLIMDLQDGRISCFSTPELVRKQILWIIGESPEINLRDFGFDERSFELLVSQAYGKTGDVVREMICSLSRAQKYHAELVRRGIGPDNLSPKPRATFIALDDLESSMSQTP